MGLGFFRLVLSIWVIDHHYEISKRLLESVVVDALGEENLGFLKIGHIAVISFFVLSGYVITWVLKNKYPHTKTGIKAFFLGRIVRIYPLYWLILTAMVAENLILPWLKTGQEVELSLSRVIGDFLLFPYGIAGFFLENNYYAYGMIDLPAWTLPYDLVFYLAAPWMVMKKKVLSSIIGLELLYLLVLSRVVPADSWHTHYLTTGHAQLLAFAFGSMAWYFRTIKIPVWLLISSLIFVLYLAFVPYMMTNLYLNHLLVILLTVVIVLGLKKRSKLDDLLGELTYSTYLLHMPVMAFVSLLIANKYQSTVAFIVSYMASIIVVKYIESPLDKKRKKMTTNLLGQAGNRSEEKSVESMSIMVLILLFLLISGGYDLLWISALPHL